MMMMLLLLFFVVVVLLLGVENWIEDKVVWVDSARPWVSRILRRGHENRHQTTRKRTHDRRMDDRISPLGHFLNENVMLRLAIPFMLACLASTYTLTRDGGELMTRIISQYPLFFSKNEEKSKIEVLYLIGLTPCWMIMFGIIVSSGMYYGFDRWSYIYVCFPMALVYVLFPWAFGLGTRSTEDNQLDYYLKANIWLGILSYVGSFYWTHYFYTLLGAKYTFDSPPAHRLNDVPIPMYFAAHAYFCFYHTLTNMLIRRVRNSDLFKRSDENHRLLLNASFIGLIAYITAFMETKTIEGFEYWEFENREKALVVGSCVYMIYFIVSFPMFLRVDESAARWTTSEVLMDSLGCCMLVTIMLDWWKLIFGAVY